MFRKYFLKFQVNYLLTFCVLVVQSKNPIIKLNKQTFLLCRTGAWRRRGIRTWEIKVFRNGKSPMRSTGSRQRRGNFSAGCAVRRWEVFSQQKCFSARGWKTPVRSSTTTIVTSQAARHLTCLSAEAWVNKKF